VRHARLAEPRFAIRVAPRGERTTPPVGRGLSDAGGVAAVVNHVRTGFGNDHRDAVTAEDVRVPRR
jgi:hypothetical protein